MSRNPHYNDMNNNNNKKKISTAVASAHVSYAPLEATEVMVENEDVQKQQQIPVAVGYNNFQQQRLRQQFSDGGDAYDLQHRPNNNNNSNNNNKVSFLRTVHGDYMDIPEARDLVWYDDFFDDDDDVVAVFDFDYETMESYYSSVNWCLLGVTMLYTPIFVIGLLGLAPCFLKRNVQWNVYAQHVAITRDGVRFVRDRRRTCWGLSCTDAGKSSKTVPFDMITDCDIEEPAGNTCCIIPNVLIKVRIDTASSGGGGEGGTQRHELEIAGLYKAHEFKKLVWAMKRRYRATSAGASFPMFCHSPQQQQSIMTAMEMAGRGDGVATTATAAAAAAASDDVTALLREIRDELRHNNNLLVSIKEKDQIISDDQSTLILE